MEYNRAFFSRKGPYQRHKNLFREETVYLEPKGILQAKKGPFGDEKEPFGAKKKPFGVERALLEPEMDHFKQTNSFSDPKRAHWRQKMVLWKRKRSFQSQKDPFGVAKGPFVVKSFPSGPKRARRA